MIDSSAVTNERMGRKVSKGGLDHNLRIAIVTKPVKKKKSLYIA